MNAFLVSKAARADLKNIAAYMQKIWGTQQHRAYFKNLDLAFHFMAQTTLASMSCNYIVEGLRKHRFESHTIFYENINNQIIMLRVLHKNMDVEHTVQT